MTKLNLHSLRRLAGSVALLALLFFSPQIMRADTAAQIRDQINAYTGGGTGSLRAVTTSATNVGVSGTLTGVTSSLILNIDAGVTVSWTATISTNSYIALISLQGSGAFEVTGGAITVTNGSAITSGATNIPVTVTVSGGIVSATTGYAIETGAGNISMNGGIVSATTGMALFSHSGNISMIGGTVSATTGFGLYALGTSSKITVSGGLVFAYGSAITSSGNVIYLPNNPSGFTSPTGTGVVLAWNQSAGHTSYIFGSSDDISKSPASVTATWDEQVGKFGITYYNGGSMNFIQVDGVTVQAATDAATPTIKNQPKSATVNVGAALTLSVTASVSDGGALSYQWYHTSSLLIRGTAVSGAIAASYSPPTKTAGTYYYYVVVTNTNNSATGAKNATATSSTATVTVNAAAPSVCSIGSINYTSIDSALEAITTNAPTTIKLLTNITSPNCLKLFDRNITFDLGAYNLIFDVTSDQAVSLTNCSIDYTGTGELKALSRTKEGLSIYGGFCKLTYAETDAATGGYNAVYCAGAGKVTVNGNVVANTSSGNGGVKTDGAGCVITVSGDLTSSGYGVIANNGGAVTIGGNITADNDAIYLNGGLTVTVSGNVTTTGSYYGIFCTGSDAQIDVAGSVTANSPTFWSIYAESGSIRVGNVKATNGVMAINKGTTVTVDGTISASGIYIQTGSTPKTKNNYESATTLTGYLTYTDGASTVWVKSAGTGIETISQSTGLKAWAANGTLHVSGLTAGKPWRVYTVTGVLVTSPGPSKGGEEVTTSLPGHGIYIVQSGNWTAKVVN